LEKNTKRMPEEYRADTLVEELAEKVKGLKTYITARDNEGIYHYENGIYNNSGETLIKEQVQELANIWRVKCSTHTVNEVLNNVRRTTYKDRKEFNKEKHLIHLQNGVYDLSEKTFKPHTSTIISTVQLPIDFNPQADCPEIRQFLDEICYPQDIPAMEELLGYLLFKGYPIKKAFMLVGDGDNGKTTFMNMVNAFLGQENIVSLSLHRLAMDRFSLARLYGKLANVYDDLPSKALLDTGVFKMLTGNSPLTADKKFQDGFEFVNHAKLIFSANKPPQMVDDTDAFFERWNIIIFPNQFRDGNKDVKKFEKITTPNELSGLFNLALDGLERLLDQGKFTNTKSNEETRQQLILLSNPVGGFVMRWCKQGDDERISKGDLYNAFMQYCEVYRLVKPAKNKFSMDLQKEALLGEQKSTGGAERRWTGISLNSKEEVLKGMEEREEKQEIMDLVDSLSLSLWNENKTINEGELSSSTQSTIDSNSDDIKPERDVIE